MRSFMRGVHSLLLQLHGLGMRPCQDHDDPIVHIRRELNGMPDWLASHPQQKISLSVHPLRMVLMGNIIAQFDGSAKSWASGAAWTWHASPDQYTAIDQCELLATGSWSLLPGTNAVDAELCAMFACLAALKSLLQGRLLDHIAETAFQHPLTVHRKST